MDILGSLWNYIRANCFYDLRSSVISICVIIGLYYFYKLLKDNGEKVYKSMRYLTCLSVCIIMVAILVNHT